MRIRADFAIAVAVATLAVAISRSAHARPPMADLIITGAIEYGTTCRVQIKNQGTAPSGACWLWAFKKTGPTSWSKIGEKWAPGLAAGQSAWVSITAPEITLSPTAYQIDATLMIPESNDANNLWTVF